MNRILRLTLIAGCAVAASAAVRTLRKRREAVETQAALQVDIERFENEGGRVLPT